MVLIQVTVVEVLCVNQNFRQQQISYLMVSQTFPLTGNTQTKKTKPSHRLNIRRLLGARLGVFGILKKHWLAKKKWIFHNCSPTHNLTLNLSRQISKALTRKVKSFAISIQQVRSSGQLDHTKTSLESPQLFDKVEFGQTLIPDDTILGEETRLSDIQ